MNIDIPVCIHTYILIPYAYVLLAWVLNFFIVGTILCDCTVYTLGICYSELFAGAKWQKYVYIL